MRMRFALARLVPALPSRRSGAGAGSRAPPIRRSARAAPRCPRPRPGGRAARAHSVIRPEVADEAAVVAAEAVQEERPDRPRPELALAPQARARRPPGPRRCEPLEVERRRDVHERRRAPRGEAARRDLRGREPGEVGAGRREHEARVRLPRTPHERALDAPRLFPGHELPGERPQRAHARRSRCARHAGRGRAPRARPAARPARPWRGRPRCRRRAPSRKRRRSSALSSSGASRAICRSPPRALRDTRVGRPGGGREDELRTVRAHAQRAVPHPVQRHAEVVGLPRPQLDEPAQGSSPAAGGGARANPGAISSSVAMRARPPAQPRLLVARQPERAGHVEPRDIDVGRRLQQRRSTAPPLGEADELASVAARQQLVGPGAGKARQARRGAVLDRQCGRLPRQHGAQLRAEFLERRQERTRQPAVGAADVVDHERVPARAARCRASGSDRRRRPLHRRSSAAAPSRALARRCAEPSTIAASVGRDQPARNSPSARVWSSHPSARASRSATEARSTVTDPPRPRPPRARRARRVRPPPPSLLTHARR